MSCREFLLQAAPSRFRTRAEEPAAEQRCRIVGGFAQITANQTELQCTNNHLHQPTLSLLTFGPPPPFFFQFSKHLPV